MEPQLAAYLRALLAVRPIRRRCCLVPVTA